MDITWIEPNVLAVSQMPRDMADVQSLREQGIRAIVSLTEYPLNTIRDFRQATFDKLGIAYLHAPVLDFQAPTIECAQAVIDFIAQMREAGRPVLLHCYAGVGRTGTLLHAYYLTQGLSLAEAQTRIEQISPRNRYEVCSPSQQEFLEKLERILNEEYFD